MRSDSQTTVAFFSFVTTQRLSLCQSNDCAENCFAVRHSTNLSLRAYLTLPF